MAHVVHAKSTRQPASDTLDGVEICHVESVGVLGVGCDLLQLLLQRLPDPHGEHPDSRFGGGDGGLQNVILTPAVRHQYGHLLDVLVGEPSPRLGGEDVVGGVADGLSGFGVPAEVADVPRCLPDLLQGFVPGQVELCGWTITIAHHSHPGLILTDCERVHHVGHPLTDLLEVVLSYAGRRVQNEDQIIVYVLTTCSLTLNPAAVEGQGQNGQNQSDPEAQSRHLLLLLLLLILLCSDYYSLIIKSSHL